MLIIAPHLGFSDFLKNLEDQSTLIIILTDMAWCILKVLEQLPYIEKIPELPLQFLQPLQPLQPPNFKRLPNQGRTLV